MSDQAIITRLAVAAQRHPDRPMVTIGRETWSYSDVWGIARRTASAIVQRGRNPLVAFFCDRDETAYISVLAILAAGRGYVVLSPKQPNQRIRHIVAATGVDCILVGKGMEERAAALFSNLSVHLICLGHDDKRLSMTQECVTLRGHLLDHDPIDPVAVPAHSIAYLLFTSGSTGVPKGVPVSNGNLCAYVDYITQRYAYCETDVHSQTFELTFDLSAHDMMCAWSTGGRLVRFSGAELIAPAGVVRKQGVTCWFSVPSLGSIMERSGGLKSGRLSSLRVSLFCGEAMPAKLAARWTEAAPDSVIENLYGPTEATIAFTHYRWDAARSEGECRHGLVPIGQAFPGQQTAVVDEANNLLSAPCKGMLLLSGSQVTAGYWNAPEITAEKYLELPGVPGGPWYSTGDIVEVEPDGCIRFVGRLDSQIKYRGFRIELLEVEGALREAANTDLAVVVAWPIENHEVKGLTAAIGGPPGDWSAIAERMRNIVPDYMVPDRVRFFDELPRNLSGKIDRKAILALLGPVSS